MVEISEIVDEASLRKWLEALPFDEDEKQRIAVNIAHRSAMRVLPLNWLWMLDTGGPGVEYYGLIQVLRAEMTMCVSANLFNSRIKTAGLSAEAASAEVELATFKLYSSVFEPSISSKLSDRTALYVENADDSDSASDGWSEVRSDCRSLENQHYRLDHTSLWSGENPFSKNWKETRQNLPAGYEFWRDWYQDTLDGVAPNWDMLTEIALIDPNDWEMGAEHVNGLIAGVVDKHNPKIEQLSEPAAKSQLELTSQAKLAIAQRVQFNRDGLALSLAGVLEQIAVFREKIRGLNGLDPDYRKDLLKFLDELSGQLGELLHSIPDEDEEISDEKADALAGWWQRFKPLVTQKAKGYVSPENAAEAAVPSGIILGCAGVGAIVGGPVGFGAGAYVGGLITGHVKPNKAMDELLERSSDQPNGD